MPRPRYAFQVAALIAGVHAAGCADPEPSAPAGRALESAADSLAARIEDAAGGRAAFDALPALRWDFFSRRDTADSPRRRHLWDRAGARHRLEWTAGDSLLVAVFSTTHVTAGVPEDGRVYFDGSPLDSADGRLRLGQAYARFINDMYWLLAPLKLFDPGVTRTLAPDSSDASSEVLALSFAGVGLTPGDRYWMRADRRTGSLLAWSFHLESDNTGTHDWNDPRDIATPTDTLHLAAVKTARGGLVTIHTPAAAGVAEEPAFTDPRPNLAPLE